MRKITELLTEAAARAFESCGYDPKLATVAVSDRQDLCQFQCNGAFAGAKLYKKAPFVIAEEAAAVLAADERIASVEAVKPGFINITLKDEFLVDYVNQIAADEHLGVPQAENPETIVIDYGGPNVAKPLHIGHLRSAIIGEAVKKNRQSHRQNHLRRRSLRRLGNSPRSCNSRIPRASPRLGVLQG